VFLPVMQKWFPMTNGCKDSCVFLISQAEMARLTLKLLKIESPFVVAIDRTE
jgi:hypothetical protein